MAVSVSCELLGGRAGTSYLTERHSTFIRLNIEYSYMFKAVGGAKKKKNFKEHSFQYTPFGYDDIFLCPHDINWHKTCYDEIITSLKENKKERFNKTLADMWVCSFLWTGLKTGERTIRTQQRRWGLTRGGEEGKQQRKELGRWRSHPTICHFVNFFPTFSSCLGSISVTLLIIQHTHI